MTSDEATEVLTLLSAGFPRHDWPESTKRLWRLELAPLGAREGLATARQVIRGHEFLSFKAFFEELAGVRERRLDENRSATFDRPALAPVRERITPREEAKVRFAELRAQLDACRGPLVQSLRASLPRARVDQNYFDPPRLALEPEPTTEEEK